jgi:hypothetical protein
MIAVGNPYPAGYETFSAVAERWPSFIVQVYNSMRLPSAVGYQLPEEFAIQLAQQVAYFDAPRWSSPRGSLIRRIISIET